MSRILPCTENTLRKAAQTLLDGGLVVFPTETVYGLGGDALNKQAISRIYNVKSRPLGHPLIVHFSSLGSLNIWTQNIPEYAVKLAKSFWPGPMTLILPRTGTAKDYITGKQNCVGVRIPDQKIALSLLREFEKMGGLGVAAPSANRFGKISPTSAKNVFEDLDKYLAKNDLILNDGICQIGLESTIIDCRFSKPQILRPGPITEKMIHDLCNLQITLPINNSKKRLRVSGSLKKHYAPQAKVFLDGIPRENDGLIALSTHDTPEGVIRLANPKNVQEFANQLYSALRLGDKMNIKKIFVYPPSGIGLELAIKDRLIKML